MLNQKYWAFSFDILSSAAKINQLINTTKSLLEKALQCSLSTAEGCSVINNLSAVSCSSYHSLCSLLSIHLTHFRSLFAFAELFSSQISSLVGEPCGDTSTCCSTAQGMVQPCARLSWVPAMASAALDSAAGACTRGPYAAPALPRSHPAVCYVTVSTYPGTAYSDGYTRKWKASGKSMGWCEGSHACGYGGGRQCSHLGTSHAMLLTIREHFIH